MNEEMVTEIAQPMSESSTLEAQTISGGSILDLARIGALQQAILQNQQAQAISSKYSSSGIDSTYASVLKKVKGGVPAQKAIDELLIEKGLSPDSSESDSFESLESAVVSNRDNPNEKGTISATDDTILLLFKEKKTGNKGILRIDKNGAYQLFVFEGLPVHPADQIVYSAPPVVQPASTPSTPAPTPTPAPSKNITPYVYAGIGLIVILVVARMVTKK